MSVFVCRSAAVQQCLMVNSVCEAIKEVDRLAALDSGLNHSSCSHLQKFLRETLCFWHNIIKERLSRSTQSAFKRRVGR